MSSYFPRSWLSASYELGQTCFEMNDLIVHIETRLDHFVTRSQPASKKKAAMAK